MPQIRPPNSIASVRDMLRIPHDKIPPDLRHALTLLNFKSLTDLEERLLATTAFLAPWSVFRDSSLLVDNSSASETSDITRLDILWFYTQFDEGLRRHDPRAERPDTSFEIDKSEWTSADHEKHLSAWLLQTFCVGKAYSPFGLEYFELRNICTAWEEVFVPIIKAVRTSYSVRGRRHYGRLALFIEERCPSRLAFPESNVDMPGGVIDSPTPFRVVSRPTPVRGVNQAVLTRKNYDEAERELRDVYPQYGGLVERPRFKQKMDEWLEVQRTRAAHRKTTTKPEVAQYVHKYQPQTEQPNHIPHDKPTTKPTSEVRNLSPVKRYSDSIRRSLSMNNGNSRFRMTEPQSPLPPTRPKTPDTPKVPMIPYGMYSYVPKVPKEQPKSPLHGVTRQIYIPDSVSDRESQLRQETDITRNMSPDNDSTQAQPALPKELPFRQSEGSVIHNSKSFSDTKHGDGFLPGAKIQDDVWSPMGAPSAIPVPLKKLSGRHNEVIPQSLPKANKSFSEVRHPSYEGNDYQREISLSNLHSRKVSADGVPTSSGVSVPKTRSRVPTPIKVPPPYAGQLRVASNDTYRTDTVPRSTGAVQPSNLARSVPWPGTEKALPRPLHAVSDIAPPIPMKSPRRRESKRGQMSEQLPRQETLTNRTSHEVFRIVSKDNIRAALSNLTPESSMEDLRTQVGRHAPTRVASPPKLEAYNTHMFPRKDSHPQ
ncbi:hypothetical protein OPT61_g460 [Boeremia exigua]|uniref:Uncharacterized protein n=1 Tax=Boeremia exigua TaxID=749465 RepID=A0ACC2IU52_9PLEO|nr:hypothetical protein OPT61_g460 [Boeremia exigua]